VTNTDPAYPLLSKLSCTWNANTNCLILIMRLSDSKSATKFRAKCICILASVYTFSCYWFTIDVV